MSKLTEQQKKDLDEILDFVGSEATVEVRPGIFQKYIRVACSDGSTMIFKKGSCL